MKVEMDVLGRPLRYRPITAVAPDGVRISVQDHGRDTSRQDVVFVHGFSQSSLAWLKQVTGPLSTKLRMVTYDLRGHGASDKPIEPERYRDPEIWAGELAAVMDAAGLRDPIVVAWSYAGRIAYDYLSVFGGGNVSGIMAVAATSHGGPDHLGPATPLLRRMAGAEDVAENLVATAALLDACTAMPLDGEERALMLGYNMLVPPQVRRAMVGREAAYDQALAGFRKPMLAIHGGRDPINLVSMSLHTAATVPFGRAVVYDGSGHMPFWEEPDRFDADLLAFADELTGHADGIAGDRPQ